MTIKREQEDGQDQLSASKDLVSGTETLGDAGRPLWRRRSLIEWMYLGAILAVAWLILLLLSLAVQHSILDKFFPKPLPTATPTASITPIPISLTLPDLPAFPLMGEPPEPWPRAPWSVPTGQDMCTTVLLPWSAQLEAVLRTLSLNDEIKLTMSNYNSLHYRVQSIEQVRYSDIDKLAKANFPCLLVILRKADQDTNWVVTAKPR